jgi:hypothetical protein
MVEFIQTLLSLVTIPILSVGGTVREQQVSSLSSRSAPSQIVSSALHTFVDGRIDGDSIRCGRSIPIIRSSQGR